MRNKKKRTKKRIRDQIDKKYFRLEIEERIKKKEKRKIKGKLKSVERTTYRPIKPEQFRKDRYYRLYLIHKHTKQKRLFGFGKFNNIPMFSTHPDSKGRELGGRFFYPNVKKLKRKGGWVPVKSIIRDIEKELEDYGKNFRHEVRGAIIPPKNYYHVDWKIFSDKPLPGNTVWKKFAISAVIEYLYTSQQWIGKKTIVVDTLDKGIQIKNLHKYEDRWKFELGVKLDETKQNRKGHLNIIEINGFVPVAYDPSNPRVIDEDDEDE